jgi:hypothetical protein
MNLNPTAWTDISTETVRTYHYGNGFNLNVPAPKLLNIQTSSMGGHSHRIQTQDGKGIYIAPGWVAISWSVAEGAPIFTF